MVAHTSMQAKLSRRTERSPMRDEHDRVQRRISERDALDKWTTDRIAEETRIIRRARPLRLRRRFERWQYAIVGAGALIAAVVAVVAR